MKAFFEEYGLVLVVTVIATGMIAFSDGFKDQMTETLDGMWKNMTSGQVEWKELLKPFSYSYLVVHLFY